jgi:flagellar basal body-associated protein FliL
MSEQPENTETEPAEQDPDSDDPSLVDDGEEESKPKSKILRTLERLPGATKFLSLDKKKRIAIAAAGGLIVISGIAAPVFLVGGDEVQREVVVTLGEPLVQHEFPLFLADLTPTRRRSSHVKMKMIVEIDAEGLHVLTDKENDIMAAVLAHLRDQTREVLYGKEGTARLRRELLDVVNQEIKPNRADSILFTELLIN